MDPCASVREMLNDYIDGTLGSVDTIRVVGHLRACRACAAEFTALRATRDLLRRADVPPMGASQDRVRNRLRAQFDAADSRVTGPKHGWMRAHGLGIASAVAATTALVWVMATLPTGLRVEPDTSAGVNTAELVPTDVLPSTADIDRMTYLHAAHTREVLSTGVEVQRDAFADANARLEMDAGDGDR